jgi:glycosyltransferase involved in cell wall biosynthesis
MISYSILIVTYNQKETLGKILDRLARQIKNPKMFEIVVADDCSDDGTESFVKRLRLPIFLKYTRAANNVGRSIIRNTGFQKTAGQKVIFLDGDMVPGPVFIDSFIGSWDRHPASVILGSWRNPPEWKNDRLYKYLSSRGRQAATSETQIPGKYFTSGNFSIDRNIFERLSGFDLSFEGWKGEDTDFGLRLEKESTPIWYNPDAVCYHYHKKSLEDMLGEYERYGRTSYRVLLEKHPDKLIFDKGWILGLPDPKAGTLKKAVSKILSPLRSDSSISILKTLEKFAGGALFLNFCYDWLFYSRLARGYREGREKPSE